MKNGTIVTLKEKSAKWFLEHPEVFIKPSGVPDKEFYDYMQLSMLRLLGWNFQGEVTHQGNEDCVYVKWKVPRGFKSYTSYFDKHNLVKVRK